HAKVNLRPSRTYAAVAPKSETKSQVRPLCRQTAGAEKSPPPLGVGSVCNSPPLIGPAPPLPFSFARSSTRIFPSFPLWTARPLPSSAGAVDPTSTSPELSELSSVGVQFWSSLPASGDNSRTLSPQYVWPSHLALPVATSRFPLPGSTTTPARAQIAESLSGQVDGWMIACRSLQSEFQTWTRRPEPASIAATWPW